MMPGMPAYSKPFNFRTMGWLFIAVFLSSLLALLLSITGPEATIGLMGVLLLVALGFLDYPKFLLLAVFIRSALDTFTNTALPIGPLNLNPAGLLGLSLVFFTPLHCLNKNGFSKFPVVKGFSIFLLLCAPAVFSAFRYFGFEGAVAVKEFIRLTSLFCLLISLLVFFKTPAETKKLFYAALASLAIPLGVGLYQVLTGTGNTVSTDGQNRIFGTLFHPNTFSLYLTGFIAVSLAWHRNAPSLGKKLLLGILLATQFLTYSMGGLVATGLIFGLHFWQSKTRRLWLILPFFFLPALALFSQNWQTRFSQLRQMRLSEEIQEQEVSNSFSWRVLHWYVLLQYAKEHPITGWGLLTTEKITPWKTEEGQGFAAHNDLVRLFLETGLVGVAGYFIFLYSTGRWIFGRRKNPDGTGESGLSTPLKAVFGALLLLSFAAEEPLVHTAFVYYFFTFIVLEKNGFSFHTLKQERPPAGKIAGGKP